MTKQKRDFWFFLGCFAAMAAFSVIGLYFSIGRIQDGAMLSIHGPRALGSFGALIFSGYMMFITIKNALKKKS